jgi:hypothetical protein
MKLSKNVTEDEKVPAGTFCVDDAKIVRKPIPHDVREPGLTSQGRSVIQK